MKKNLAIVLVTGSVAITSLYLYFFTPLVFKEKEVREQVKKEINIADLKGRFSPSLKHEPSKSEEDTGVRKLTYKGSIYTEEKPISKMPCYHQIGKWREYDPKRDENTLSYIASKYKINERSLLAVNRSWNKQKLE
jgi:hypothetical protein